MSEVSFPGEPPFYLPTAQNASATALGETVELTLRVVAPGHGPGPQAVRAAMTWKVARQLLDQLGPAVLQAEMTAAKSGQDRSDHR
jgi:hypothetical protein